MITFAEVDTLLRSAQPFLAATLYPAAALLGVVHGAELHRLGDENIHTVDDYKPTPEPERVVRERRRLRRTSDTPIHDRLVAELYAEQVVAEVMRERYGTTDPGRVAVGMLAEIGAEQQANAGIYPPEHWVARDGASCWVDCPGCAYDLTGAFPVVAVSA